MTVAAQQRAEAAYRRQRMAQERAELTAVWRADMEVERARMLKEMSGGGSRRPSYCKELEDLKEEDPYQGEVSYLYTNTTPTLPEAGTIGTSAVCPLWRDGIRCRLLR